MPCSCSVIAVFLSLTALLMAGSGLQMSPISALALLTFLGLAAYFLASAIAYVRSSERFAGHSLAARVQSRLNMELASLHDPDPA
jgi:hypothetical protein